MTKSQFASFVLPMLRALIVALALSVASAWTPALRPPVIQGRFAQLRMVDQFRWSKAKAGDKADLGAAPADIKWAKAAWESLGKDGKASVTDECYMISDQAPDASKEVRCHHIT